MKLWVDDIRNPEAKDEKGRYLYVDDPTGWVWVKTVTAAIHMLDSHDMTEVSLDFDISHKVSIGHGDPRPFASPETFEPVARFLARTVEKSITARGTQQEMKIRIHTANPVGAQMMKEILDGFEVEIRPQKPCNRFEDPS